MTDSNVTDSTKSILLSRVTDSNVGSVSLKVLCDAGTDRTKHRLVKVYCPRCASNRIMRAANVKRNKSCGCLKHEASKVYNARRKSKPLAAHNPNFWSQFCDKGLTPMEICNAAMASGKLYQPQWKR